MSEIIFQSSKKRGHLLFLNMESRGARRSTHSVFIAEQVRYDKVNEENIPIAQEVILPEKFSTWLKTKVEAGWRPVKPV